MFEKEVYIGRRAKLRDKMDTGLVVIPGNPESPMNYPDNPYPYRQDSSFLYFFGLNFPGVAGIIDIDNDHSYIYGDDVDMSDIIWMGPQPAIKDIAAKVGIENTAPFKEFKTFLEKAMQQGRKIHFLPQYRAENKILLGDMLGIYPSCINQYVSRDLIKAVISLREIKDEFEIKELEKAAKIGREMHLEAMRMAADTSRYERDISGKIEGIALSYDGYRSFPVILTQNGETLHNHYHGNKLEKGRLMLTDAGAETPMGYASDISRTVPVGGKFTEDQKAIYQIVKDANNAVAEAIKPGVTYLSMHTLAVKTIVSGLKDLGIMKGDVDEAVNKGAHALFMPHGVGHMMGLDVHDLEGVDEDLAGYGEDMKRSEIFGFSGLRLAKELKPGFVLTNEPGTYFIPELIKRWKQENKFKEHINYDTVEKYIGFGGIRLEDDILVTENGAKVLGERLPIEPDDVEKTMKG